MSSYGKHYNRKVEKSTKRIRLNASQQNGPGPGAYEDQKEAIHKAVDDFVKKNAIVAKKVEINQKLRSKLSQIIKAKKTSENEDLDLEETPLIQIYDRLKKEGDKLPKPFESPDISITKERSPCTIISHQKYSNPLANQTILKIVDQTTKLQQQNQSQNNSKKPPRPQTIPDAFIKHVDRFITNKASIIDNRAGKL